MMAHGDGVLRAQSFELSGVLVNRADNFLAERPRAEDALRRILTLKLATVREDGEPTRRRARRSEFTDEEWVLVSELADYPNRLLVVATSEAGQTYAEVAHETMPESCLSRAHSRFNCRRRMARFFVNPRAALASM